MKKLIYLMMLFTLLLAACSKAPEPIEDNTVERKNNTTKENIETSSEEDSKEEKSESKEENQSDNNSEKVSKKEEKKDDVLIKREDLTLEQIIALAIIEQKPVKSTNDYVTATAKDFLNHQFPRPNLSEDDTQKVEEVHEIGIVKGGFIEKGFHERHGAIVGDVPYDFYLYGLYPDYFFGTIVGVGEEKVILAVVLEQEHFDTITGAAGHEYDIDELYEKNKNNEQVLELADMMQRYESREIYYENNSISDPYNSN